MRKTIIALAVSAALVVPSAAYAIGSSSSSSSGSSSSSAGSRSSTPSTSSSRPSSSGWGSSSSSSSTSSSSRSSAGRTYTPTKPTATKPSSGPRANPPSTRIVPTNIGSVRVPAGRNALRDSQVLRSNPSHLDPYGPSYYGHPWSPYHYLFLAAVADGGDDPLPPQDSKDVGACGGGVVLPLGALGIGAWVRRRLKAPA